MNTEMKTNGEHWNLFFSSLAYAEQAAADQCRVIAQQLSSTNEALAIKYQQLAIDEDSHFALAAGLCEPLAAPSQIAQEVYRGDLMNADASTLERMAIIHLVFEPSALAFLGYLKQHANDLLISNEQAIAVKNCFSDILKDEVTHVYEGKKLVAKQMEKSSAKEIQEAKRSIRRHRAFLIAGLKKFFFKSSPDNEFVHQMLIKFKFYFEKSNKGVFA